MTSHGTPSALLPPDRSGGCTRPSSGGGAVRGRDAWRGAAGAAAIVVLLVQLAWRTAYLAEGYFTQDDFLMLHLGGTSAFGLPYLFRDYSGHLFPGGFLIAYLEARLAPLSWPAAYLPVVVMQLAAGMLAWAVLSRLLGARWERLPILAVFCFCPLSLWSTQWWAVAIQFVPLEVCGLAAVLCYLRWRQDADVRGRRLTPLLVVAALLFEERGVLLPLVLYAVAVLMEPGATVRERLWGAVRSNRWLGLWLAAVVGAYLVVHAVLAPVNGTPGGGGNESLDLVTNFLFRNVVPGVAGGPWTGTIFDDAAVIPPGWVVVVTVALLAALVVYTASYGGSAARACWLVLLAYALVDGLLVFGGRAQYGSLSGLTPRYAADLLPILAVTLAGAVRDVEPPSRVAQWLTAGRRRPGRRTLAFLAATVVYAGSAAQTTQLLAPAFFNEPARSYVTNLSDDLSLQPDVALYDSTVPEDVMISWFGADDRVSTVYGIAPDAPAFDVASEQLRMVDAAGHVRPITLVDPVDAVDGPNPPCGYNITLEPTMVGLRGVVPLAKNVVRLTYFTDVDDVAVLTAGSQTVRIPVHPGPHEVDAVVDAGFGSVSLRLSRSAGTLCLVALSAGVPQPAAP